MFWGCFAASGTGCLDCVHGIMNSEDYQIILERNEGPVSESWDNDTAYFKKHTEMV